MAAVKEPHHPIPGIATHRSSKNLALLRPFFMRHPSLAPFVVTPALCLLLAACKPNATTDSKYPAQNVSASSSEKTPEEKAEQQEFASWSEKAKQNDPEAFLQVGRGYLQGRGIAQDDAKAAEYFRKAAELGNWKAQNNLGLLYASGRGVDKNIDEATKWLRKAAESGSVDAQVNFASMLTDGHELHQDFQEATKWFEKAAEQNSLEAQRQLGRFYYFGDHGLPLDYELASKWLTMAADQGDPWSQNTLGAMNEHAQGTKKDIQRASDWYRKAAEQGDAKGQSNLGRLLAHNYGLPGDKVEAYKWLSLSSEQGEVTAQNSFVEFKRSLNSIELAEAQRRVEEFKQRRSIQTVNE
jgi:TPR repeat protein